MVLGPEWFESDARGVRSGVELGFLSTTLSESVALEYSGVKSGTGIILEFNVGAIDCGARLDSISQYPGVISFCRCQPPNTNVMIETPFQMNSTVFLKFENLKL
jgi:hypothetical protein